MLPTFPPRCLLLVLVALVLLLAGPSSASATDFTWNGDQGTDFAWSKATNWQGGTAPTSSAAIGTLTFQPFDPSCQQFRACANSVNDLDGISIDHLEIGSSLSDLSGNGISLGSGGLSATRSSSIYLRLPITLSASQTWNVNEGDGSFVLQDPLSGPGDLTLHGGMWLYGDSELGDVTADDGGFVLLGDPRAIIGLNASNGHALNFNNGGLTAAYAAVGALHGRAAVINVGDEFNSSGPGTLSTAGMTLDAASELNLSVTGTGTRASTDYGQLTSNGPVALGGSTLNLAVVSQSQCDALPIGQSYTLVSTTGGLSGSFGNAPEGSSIADTGACDATSYRIDYHESGPVQTVTATVQTSNTGAPPVNLTLPPIESDPFPLVGYTLIGDTGTWSGDRPQTYAFQWLRDGSPIAGATFASYVVTADDQGHQLTLRVTASNSSGSASATTAPFAIPPAAGGGGSRSGSGGGTGGVIPPSRPASVLASTASVGKISIRSGAVVVPLTCSTGSGCPLVTVELSVVEHLRGGKITAVSARKQRRKTRTVVIGKASTSLTAGQSQPVTVGLNRAGRGLLRRFGRLRGTVTIRSGGRVAGVRRVGLKATGK